MYRLTTLAAVLAAAFALFFAATATPPPRPANAPPRDFSAGRAMADITAMAPAPHPVGSAADARVRDYLIARMTALGLAPQVQRDESHRSEAFGGADYLEGAEVENVIGVLPGRDHALPALVLMAHRDSVPGSPGAADDVTGVACALEIVRAIETRGPPQRDVIVAITDGEESGLLGANAFFGDNPLAARVGFVINLEARGGGGRAAMFETGADNGAAIDLFARTAMRPASTSLSVFVYKLLPNDTDFTIAKARGLAGLNFAFIGRQFDYHSPSSTVAALDKGAVQHMGDEVLGVADALARAPQLPARTPDKVYADLLGLTVIAYPAWGGWIALAIAGGLVLLGAWRARRAGELRAVDLVKGAACTLLILMLAAAVLTATRYLTGAGFGFMAQRPLLARFPAFEIAMALSGLGALLLSAALAAGGQSRLAGVWCGLLLAALVPAAALQATAPTIAFVVVWPLIAAGLLSALTADGARGGAVWAAGALILVIATAWLGVLLHLLMEGLDAPQVPAAIVWLLALGLWPLAWPSGDRAQRFGPPVLVLAGALTLAIFLKMTSPWTPDRPEAAEPLYVVNPDAGRAWRADQVGPGAWSRTWLGDRGVRPRAIRLPGLGRPIAAVPAPLVAAPGPSITLARTADGEVTLRAQPAGGATILRVDIFCDTLLMDSRVNGRPDALAAPGQWTHVVWQAVPEGFVLSFRPVGPGKLTLRWAQYLPGWPAGATPLPSMPKTTMDWDQAPATVVTGSRTLGI